MKSEHLNAERLSAYRLRRLPPNELLAASDHLAGCEECPAQLLGLPADEPVPRSGSVTYEELAAWVDDELEPIERREVQAKLLHSPAARRELADLARFKIEMSRPRVAAADNIVPGFFGRWALPLAAAIALTLGGLWWSMHARLDSAAFVRLQDGGRELRISRGGDSDAFSVLSSVLRAALKEAALGGRIEMPAEVTALAGHSGRLAGNVPTEATAFRVLAPVTTALRDGKPQFRWTDFPEATAYRIRVLNSTTEEIVLSETIDAQLTVWRPAQPLAAGETYEWEVEALRGQEILAKAPEPPQPEARFAVITEEKRRELDEVREHSPGSHLVAGVADARAGLLDDAAAEFAALAKENPDSEIPGHLLEQIERAKEPVRQD